MSKEIKIPLNEWLAIRKEHNDFNKLLRKVMFKRFIKRKLSLKGYLINEFVYYKCKISAGINDIKYLLDRKNWW